MKGKSFDVFNFSKLNTLKLPFSSFRFHDKPMITALVTDSMQEFCLNFVSGFYQGIWKLKSGTTNQRSNQLSYIRHLVAGPIITQFLPKSQVKKFSIALKSYYIKIAK